MNVQTQHTGARARAASFLDSIAFDLSPPAPSVSGPMLWTGLALLVGLCAVLGWARWGMWGDLTIDCGREMYVPWALSQGKVLYTDVRYIYGPLAPYLNSLLFRFFGSTLSVLYVSGLTALLVEAIGIYLTGVSLYAPVAGLAAAAVVILQSLEPWIHTYPLPYSFASVYGSAWAALWLLCAVRAARNGSRRYVFLAGLFAGLAFITKLEFGVACYAVLALLLAARALRSASWRGLVSDVSVLLPGVLLCAATVAWMVSLRGVEFITQENLMSWPTHYFMRVYGKRWLAFTAAYMSTGTLIKRIIKMAMFLAGWIWGRKILGKWSQANPRSAGRALAAAAACLLVVLSVVPGSREKIAILLVPPYMLMIVALSLPLLAWTTWRKGYPPFAVALLIAFSFSVVLAIRVAAQMQLSDYAIHYNGPAMLAFVLLLSHLVPGAAVEAPSFRSTVARATPFAFCAAAIYLVLPLYRDPIRMERFDTGRGVIYVPSVKIPAYREAIEFIRDAEARGLKTISVPEDVAIHFFIRAPYPVSEYVFTPGVVPPGAIAEALIREMEAAPVHYVLWTNNQGGGLGDSRFGVDYNQELGNYIRSNFRPIVHFGPGTLGGEPLEEPRYYRKNEWHASVWERIAAPSSSRHQ